VFIITSVMIDKYLMSVQGYNVNLQLQFLLLRNVRKTQSIFRRVPFVCVVINNVVDQNTVFFDR
jgi:hypothetical protein